MLARCYDPKHQSFSRYGARGILVCDRWWTDFKNFLEDMGERPKGYTLDRIDPNGDYSKSNCRWVCPARQQHHRRDSKLSWEKISEIKHMREEGFTHKAIAETFGVVQSTIGRVLSGKRWKPELPPIKPEDGTST